MFNRKGEATLGEIMLILVLVGVIMWGQYQDRKKQSEADILNGNATKNQSQTTSDTVKYQLGEVVFAPFNFSGCVPKAKLDTLMTASTAAGNKQVTSSDTNTDTQKTIVTPVVPAPAPTKEASGW